MPRPAPIATLAMLTCVAHAGPLNPPVGTPTNTALTLDQVEPSTPLVPQLIAGDATALFIIDQPGAYHLVGNIQPAPGQRAISITALDATLDLRGFTITGNPGDATDAIRLTTPFLGEPPRATIRNGTIRDAGGDAIDTATGAILTATDLLIENVERGIDTFDNARLHRITVRNTTSEGIATRSRSIITHCVVDNAGGNGFNARNDSVFIACISTGNADDGFSLDGSNLLQHCLTENNTGRGYSGFASNTFVHCTAEGDAAGGFSGVTQNRFQHCAVNSSGATSIAAGDRATVLSCSITRSVGTGISLRGDSLIRGNTIDLDPASSAFAIDIALSGYNRVEHNHVHTAPNGIRADTTNNIFTGNTVANIATTPWDIAAGNYCNIITPNPTAAPILGAAGGTPIGSTSPWVNFTY